MVNYFQMGFALAIGCLLPEVLISCGAGANTSWRAASATVAVLGIYLWVDSVIRRRGAISVGLHFFAHVNRAAYLPGVLILLLNAFKLLVSREAGVFTGAMTFMLAVAGTEYISGLNVLFREGPRCT